MNPAKLAEHDLLDRLLCVSEDLIQVHDLSSLLDRILKEARLFTRAEAGSIFLAENGHLRFSYVHNEALFKGQDSRRYLYQDFELPAEPSSLCGYVAATGASLNIADAYRLPPEAPYHFNVSFDHASGYRTRSVLVVPMRSARGRIVGVLQIINARDGEGKVGPFSARDMAYVNFFANNAALAVERALITRELVLRTVRMAQLRDPKETGAHANRVGACAAEIYQRWAEMSGLGASEIEKKKDLIRVAAMLHDVGKVAISDTILKKPGRLTPEEFATMRYHTVFGAQLFNSDASELDDACLQIALHHHERFDGAGYPGLVADLANPGELILSPLAGRDIPLMARIVALSDVYDALISRRVYKEPWPLEKVLTLVNEEKGKAFDPEVVEAFYSVADIVLSIHSRYPDPPSGLGLPSQEGGA